MEYFGTNLDEHGHYYWRLEGNKMYDRGVRLLRTLPFNPEEMPRYDKGETQRKGDVRYYQEGGFSIIAICGSCVDNRWGSKSVFFIKDQLTKTQMMNAILAIPAAKAIIDAMPFKVKWWF